jgi:hypothetical protein
LLAPGIGQQHLGFGKQPPGFGQQSPRFGQQPPGFGQQYPPGFGQQPPSFGQQYPPRFGQQPPGFGQQFLLGQQPSLPRFGQQLVPWIWSTTSIQRFFYWTTNTYYWSATSSWRIIPNRIHATLRWSNVWGHAFLWNGKSIEHSSN